MAVFFDIRRYSVQYEFSYGCSNNVFNCEISLNSILCFMLEYRLLISIEVSDDWFHYIGTHLLV